MEILPKLLSPRMLRFPYKNFMEKTNGSEENKQKQPITTLEEVTNRRNSIETEKKQSQTAETN